MHGNMNLVPGDWATAEQAKRVCHAASKKTTLVIITGVCVISLFTMMYYMEIGNMAATLNYHGYSDLFHIDSKKYYKSIWTSRENNFSVEESFEHTSSQIGSLTSSEFFTDETVSLIPDGNLSSRSTSETTTGKFLEQTVYSNNSRHIGEVFSTRFNITTQTSGEVFSNISNNNTHRPREVFSTRSNNSIHTSREVFSTRSNNSIHTSKEVFSTRSNNSTHRLREVFSTRSNNSIHTSREVFSTRSNNSIHTSKEVFSTRSNNSTHRPREVFSTRSNNSTHRPREVFSTRSNNSIHTSREVFSTRSNNSTHRLREVFSTRSNNSTHTLREVFSTRSNNSIHTSREVFSTRSNNSTHRPREVFSTRSNNSIHTSREVFSTRSNNSIHTSREVFSTRSNNSTHRPREVFSTRSDNSTHTLREVFSTTTTVTFNTTLVVLCKESPFIECSPPKAIVKSQKIFRISFLRSPSWMPRKIYNFTSCPYSQCVMEDTIITNETDVVLVYGVGLNDSFTPPKRWNKEIYAIALWESPIHTHSDFLSNASSVWNEQVNLIMSYRVDADIFVPYSKLVFSPAPLENRPNYYEIAKNKTRTAVWLVSHCETQSKREDYVREMQNYTDVDIFGRCGYPCFGCEDLSEYKFYLAFENSFCTDYVTEKFFKLFDPGMHVIPVVRGGADYDKYFANFTYINAAHFETAKDLALYLTTLASDLETYSKYLEYKDMYVQKIDVGNMACRMCEFLHTKKLSAPTTYNLKSQINDGHCHNVDDL